MIYFIAIALVLISTSLSGFMYSNRLLRRSIQIRQLLTALKILESEILFGQVPLKKAFYKISLQVPFPISTLFFEVSEALDIQSEGVKNAILEGIAKSGRNLSLEDSERQVLIQLGSSLGRYDLSSEQLNIKNAITNLERIEIESDEKYKKHGKVAQYLGVLTGLLIVVLFL